MDLKDAIAWITADADEMAALLTEADPDQPVPACPGCGGEGTRRWTRGCACSTTTTCATG